MSRVVWITGLSAAGKTTLATAFTKRLRGRGQPVVLLDGDELREVLGATTVHSREARLALAYQYVRLARMLVKQEITVVIATVALFKEIHAWNRENLPGYFEVYLRVPLTELQRRDPKGIYRRFAAGEIVNVAGLDVPIDEPVAPHVLLEFRPDLTVDSTLERLIHEFDAQQAQLDPHS